MLRPSKVPQGTIDLFLFCEFLFAARIFARWVKHSSLAAHHYHHQPARSTIFKCFLSIGRSRVRRVRDKWRSVINDFFIMSPRGNELKANLVAGNSQSAQKVPGSRNKMKIKIAAEEKMTTHNEQLAIMRMWRVKIINSRLCILLLANVPLSHLLMECSAAIMYRINWHQHFAFISRAASSKPWKSHTKALWDKLCI